MLNRGSLQRYSHRTGSSHPGTQGLSLSQGWTIVRMDRTEDCEAADPHKARARGVQAQPVQRDEDVTQVLQQVQEQRGVVAQHRDQELELLVESGWDQGEVRQRRQSWGGRRGQRELSSVLWARTGVKAFSWTAAGLSLHQQTDFIRISR